MDWSGSQSAAQLACHVAADDRTKPANRNAYPSQAHRSEQIKPRDVRNKTWNFVPPLQPSLAPPAPAATCSSSTASPSPPPPPAPRPRCVYTQARPCACRGLRVRGTWVRCVRSLIFSTPGSCRGAAGGSSWRRSWGAPCSSPRPTGSGPRRRGGSRRGPRTSTCSRGSTPRWIRRASRYVGRGGCLVGSGDQVLLADRVEMGGSWFGPVV